MMLLEIKLFKSLFNIILLLFLLILNTKITAGYKLLTNKQSTILLFYGAFLLKEHYC